MVRVLNKILFQRSAFFFVFIISVNNLFTQQNFKNELINVLKNPDNGLYSKYQADNIDMVATYWPKILLQDSLKAKEDNFYYFLFEINLNKLSYNNQLLIENNRKHLLTNFRDIFKLTYKDEESEAFSVTYMPNYGLQPYDQVLVSFLVESAIVADSIKVIIPADKLAACRIEFPFFLNGIQKIESEYSKTYYYEK